MKLLIRTCVDCGRPTVPARTYALDKSLRATYVRYGAHGMCSGCYSSAQYHVRKPVMPAVRRRARRLPAGAPCRDCGHPMVSGYQYAKTPNAHTQYVPMGGHGMCSTCYQRARRAGTVPDPAPTKPATRPVARASHRPPRELRPDSDEPHDPVELARLRATVGFTPAVSKVGA